ncbi:MULTISPECIES: SpoIIE family protein phosphatase [unclassified Streptomyces]|uniref:SpoIIE family protein phosphatase n=1 Tax=unclassified Streptomyces TaxID=2593676 RepID=UPI001E2C3934|nr:SpoIIE family protein phosphatase [Streptomyces sp. MBT42]MCD2467578.1 SpoIIE family protein phosphatase [Streptomyces sp. MBT42]
MTAGSFPGTTGRVGVPLDGKGLLDVLGVAAVVIDAHGRIVLWSPQAEDLFGFRADEALGQYMARLVVGTDHRDEAVRLFGEVLREGSTWAGVFPVRHKDGTVRNVEFRNMRLTDDLGGLYALGIAADRSAVERIEAELALSDRLVSQSPIGLAVLDTDLRYVLVNPALERINGIPAALHIGRRIGDMVPEIDAPALEAALRAVLTTGTPLLDHPTVGRTPADPDHDHAWSLSFYRLEGPEDRILGVAASVIDVTERMRADADADRSRRRLALIADASAQVGTTLEVEKTADELASVVVPELADIAAVDVLDSVLALRRPGAPEEGPELFRALAVKAAGRTEALPAADPPGAITMYGADRLVTRCVHTGLPVLVERVGPGDLSRIARSPEAAELLARAGVHSYLAVPLIARGEVLGALDLKRDRNRLPFDGDDVLLATELAARAAVSIDNARWYQSVRNSAVTLQRSLLPGVPPDQAGLEVAARYQPAQASSEVGGDWYDVIPLPDDKTALVVGDVMGSGIDAAATMGRLRTATCAFADLDLPPSEVLRHLDRITAGLEHYIATCLFAVHDPALDRVRISNAGHLPPVRVPADGPAELVTVPPGTPLGVGGGTFRTTWVPFRPGDRLVLYTDGLIETRHEAIDERLALLVGLLDDMRGPLEETCDALLRALRRPGAPDDVALLIARSTG